MTAVQKKLDRLKKRRVRLSREILECEATLAAWKPVNESTNQPINEKGRRK